MANSSRSQRPWIASGVVAGSGLGAAGDGGVLVDGIDGVGNDRAIERLGDPVACVVVGKRLNGSGSSARRVTCGGVGDALAPVNSSRALVVNVESPPFSKMPVRSRPAGPWENAEDVWTNVSNQIRAMINRKCSLICENDAQ